MLTAEEKNFLLEIARKSLGSTFSSDDNFNIIPKKLASEKLKEKKSCFVTLTIDGNLRGCVGNITPAQELYKDVAENARAAAFSDYRFSPLDSEEFKNTEIEISVLSRPKKFTYQTPKELLDYLSKNKPGVIVRKGNHSATFLPQVWEEISTSEEFLNHLCLKAGLPADEWGRGIEIEVYGVEKIK